MSGSDPLGFLVSCLTLPGLLTQVHLDAVLEADPCTHKHWRGVPTQGLDSPEQQQLRVHWIADPNGQSLVQQLLARRNGRFSHIVKGHFVLSGRVQSARTKVIGRINGSCQSKEPYGCRRCILGSVF